MNFFSVLNKDRLITGIGLPTSKENVPLYQCIKQYPTRIGKAAYLLHELESPFVDNLIFQLPGDVTYE